MSKSMKNKYNRSGAGANKAVFGAITGNTGIQEDANTVRKKKKATFELDPDIHRNLKKYAAEHEVNMVEIVEKAVVEYMDSNK